MVGSDSRVHSKVNAHQGKEKAKEESPEARVVDDVRVLQTHHFGMPWLRRQEDHESKGSEAEIYTSGHRPWARQIIEGLEASDARTLSI